MSELALKRKMPSDCCPYCGAPVGYLGRLFAWLLGTRFHGCDFSNVVAPPQELDHGRE